MTTLPARTPWAEARDALCRAGERFADLVAGAPAEPTVTAGWSIADTAAHVEILARVYRRLVACPDGSALTPADDEVVRAATVDTVAALNAHFLDRFPFRDPGVIAAMLRDDVTGLLRDTADSDPGATVAWLGGSRLPLAGLLAHLVNELLVHGRDVAKALRVPWAIPSRDAALFFDLFLVGVIVNGYGRLLDDGPVRDGRIAVRFRSRYTTTRTVVLDRGRVTLGDPTGAADVRLFFDPTALNLMLFGRVGRARTVLAGSLVVTGRRPWLIVPFLRKVHMPNR